MRRTRWTHRTTLLAVAGLAAAAVLVGPAAADDVRPAATPDSLTPRGWVNQIGTFAYLTAPDYTGLAPIRSVVDDATIGLGTFNNLSGELIIVNSTIYRVGIDGRPQIVPGHRTSPFVQAIRFTPQREMAIPRGTQCSQLAPLIDQLAATDRGVVAVRITGTFRRLQTRSVAGQRKPYPALADVIASQTVFTLDRTAATLVGFRTGTDLAGIGAPGLHLHGVTNDLRGGGHVLTCAAGKGVRLEVQRARGVRTLG